MVEEPLLHVPNQPGDTPGEGEIKAWLIDQLASFLDKPHHQVDPGIPFQRYGIDSATGIGLIGDLSELVGRELDPTLLYDYPTAEKLSRHIAGQTA